MKHRYRIKKLSKFIEENEQYEDIINRWWTFKADMLFAEKMNKKYHEAVKELAEIKKKRLFKSIEDL